MARAGELETLGFTVRYYPVDAGRLLGILKSEPPDAVVVDLSRSPAQGRDLAVALRIHGSTRRVPLVFVEGDPGKVAAVKRLLPDATYTGWGELGVELRKAIADPPSNPVVPDSALAGYSGTPLPKKLGIKQGSRVLLAGAPEGFFETLGPLPDGARLLTRYGKEAGLILWFVRSRKDLEGGLVKWVPRVGRGGIWILWPKKSSGIPSDLTQAVVRQAGLRSGLVDYKIAAVDEIWSGLKFAVRKERKIG
jgi:hypothetical protein